MEGIIGDPSGKPRYLKERHHRYAYACPEGGKRCMLLEFGGYVPEPIQSDPGTPSLLPV